MPSFQKQVMKVVNDRYIKSFITKIIEQNAQLNQEDLFKLWEEISGMKINNVKRLTGYNLFLKRVRPQVKETNPTFSSTELVTDIGKQWRRIENEDAWNQQAKNIAASGNVEDDWTLTFKIQD